MKNIKDQVLNALYSNTDYSVAIKELLEIVGEFFNVCRVYIFENSEDNKSCSNTFEWYRNGVHPEIDTLQNLSYESDLGRSYRNNFNSKGIFFCPNIEQLPECQKIIAKRQGIKAMLQCAILDGDTFKGWIGFDDCEKTYEDIYNYDDKIEALVFIAKLLSISLLQKRAMEKLSRKTYQLDDALNKLKAANEDRSTFFTRITHDMRSPLNGILSFAYTSKDETNIDVLHSNLDIIHKSGMHLLNLVNDLLDLQKMEDLTFELKREPVAIDDLFDNLNSIATRLASDKGVDFNFKLLKFPSSNPCIDPLRFTQLFLNLISNAIKFTPKGGYVDFICETIKVENNHSYNRFIVQDNGIGISEDFQKDMFKQFAQASTKETSEETGTGLGLSIVKQIVDLSGGTISCESALNKGTKFIIHLPIELLPEEEMPSNLSLFSHDFSCLNNKKILICEDNNINISVLKKILSPYNMILDIAKNGEEGLCKFAESKDDKYDLILMDVNMPLLDGYSATKLIRNSKLEGAESIPIIAMTANTSTEDINNCLECGMNNHLSKPLEPQKLFYTLKKYL
ncbi:MAG: ATP-binding protein [Anaerovoracaceae bacterium]